MKDLKSLIHFLTSKQPQGGIFSGNTPIELIARLLLASNLTGSTTTRSIPIRPFKLKVPERRKSDIEPIFDRRGKIVGWLKDNVIFDTMNQHRAFIEDEEDVFTYDCQYLGTFEEGFFRDKRGDNIAFIEGAEEGPFTPFTEIPTKFPNLPEPPEPPIPPFVPLAPLGSYRWSSLSWKEFLSS